MEGGGSVYLSMGEATILQVNLHFSKKRFPIFFGIFTIKHAILINLRMDAKISLLIQSGSQKVVEDHAITGKITPIK